MRRSLDKYFSSLYNLNKRLFDFRQMEGAGNENSYHFIIIPAELAKL